MVNGLSDLLAKLTQLETSGAVYPTASHKAPAADKDEVTSVSSSLVQMQHVFWTLTTEHIEQLLSERLALKEQLAQGGSLQQMVLYRSKLSDLRLRLTAILERCSIDSSNVVPLTEAAECGDVHVLIEGEVPLVWAQSTDDPRAIHEKTKKLRLYQRLCQCDKEISMHCAAEQALNNMRRREKRLSNDLDDARVTLELIDEVCDRFEHVKRMVERSAIDENALLQLNRTTVMEEERNRRHLAGNDIKGLKAIMACPKMKAVERAAELPETKALEKLNDDLRRVRRSVFGDVGHCRAAWKGVMQRCEDILQMVRQTCSTRDERRWVAEKAFAGLRDHFAEASIAAIR